MAAAIQFFFSYPETARKSLEEIEELFRKGGPKPWKTKIGQSGLEERTASVAESRKASVAGDDSDKRSKEVDEKEDIV